MACNCGKKKNDPMAKHRRASAAKEKLRAEQEAKRARIERRNRKNG